MMEGQESYEKDREEVSLTGFYREELVVGVVGE
jgi:hypothetical protein